MMAATTSPNLHQPDKDHARPDKANFGDARVGVGQGQAGFSRQCWNSLIRSSREMK